MKFILSISLFFYAALLSGQVNDWVYLSKTNNIHALKKDGSQLYAGTMVGLTVFDLNTGEKHVYDKTNSPLKDNWVSNIAIDNLGNKWLSTHVLGQLYKIDLANNWVKYDSSNSILNGQAIKNLVVDDNNNVWLSTSHTNGGLLKFDGVSWVKYDTSNSGLSSNYIESIFCDGNDTWIGTNIGLTKFDGVNWTTYTPTNSNLSRTNMRQITKDSNGNIWLLHYTGIEKFNGVNFTFYSPPVVGLNHFDIDQNGTFWIGCSGYFGNPPSDGGLLSFDGSNWVLFDKNNSSVNSTIVAPVLTDENGVWFGSNGDGLIGYKQGSSFDYFDPSKAEINGFIRDIVFDDKNKAYIGSRESDYGRQLVTFNWLNYSNIDTYHDQTWAMGTSEGGKLYIKNRNSLLKLENGSWSNVQNIPDFSNHGFSVDLTSILIENDSSIWADCFGGVDYVFNPFDSIWVPVAYESLAHFDGTVWTIYDHTNSPLNSTPSIYDIKTDAANHLWIATDSGLVEFDGLNWTTYNSSNSPLPSDYIFSFDIDQNDNIWLLDNNLGLILFDKLSITNFPYPRASFFGDRKVIVDIDGSVWMKGSWDIGHFDGINWIIYDRFNSPIPYSNITSLSIDDFGNKWIGTFLGVLVFNKNGVVIPEEEELPPSYSVFPNPVQNRLTIDFDASNLSDIKVYDLSGKIIMQNSSLTKSIDVSNLSAGIYLLTFNANNSIHTYKFIKQ